MFLRKLWRRPWLWVLIVVSLPVAPGLIVWASRPPSSAYPDRVAAWIDAEYTREFGPSVERALYDLTRTGEYSESPLNSAQPWLLRVTTNAPLYAAGESAQPDLDAVRRHSGAHLEALRALAAQGRAWPEQGAILRSGSGAWGLNPNFLEHQVAARTFRALGVAQLAEGDIAGALGEFEMSAAMGLLVAQHYSIGHLIAVAAQNMGLQGFYIALRGTDLGAEECRLALASLARMRDSEPRLDARVAVLSAIASIRATNWDTGRPSFRSPLKALGDSLQRQMLVVLPLRGVAIRRSRAGEPVKGDWWNPYRQQSHRNPAALRLRWTNQLVLNARLRLAARENPWLIEESVVPEEIRQGADPADILMCDAFISGIYSPNWTEAVVRGNAVMTRLRLLEVAFAARLHALETGELPGDLEALPAPFAAYGRGAAVVIPPVANQEDAARGASELIGRNDPFTPFRLGVVRIGEEHLGVFLPFALSEPDWRQQPSGRIEPGATGERAYVSTSAIPIGPDVNDAPLAWYAIGEAISRLGVVDSASSIEVSVSELPLPPRMGHFGLPEQQDWLSSTIADWEKSLRPLDAAGARAFRIVQDEKRLRQTHATAWTENSAAELARWKEDTDAALVEVATGWRSARVDIRFQLPESAWAVWSPGPDGVDDGGAILYDPTNGITSRGDLVQFIDRW